MLELEKQITEQQIRYCKNMLNRGIYQREEVAKLLPHDLTGDQNLKGLNWLFKQAFLKHSPFGFREQQIIGNFAKFELIDFINTQTQEGCAAWYQPVYKVIDKQGNYFKYVYDWQKVRVL